MSATAGPASGLTSSTTGVVVGACADAGEPLLRRRHRAGEGAERRVPDRSPTSPGARRQSRGRRVRPGCRPARWRRWSPRPTAPSRPRAPTRRPRRPDAVETAASVEPGRPDGQTTSALVSLVSEGGWSVSCTGGIRTSASSPTVTRGITTARTVVRSSRRVRLRRTTSGRGHALAAAHASSLLRRLARQVGRQSTSTTSSRDALHASSTARRDRPGAVHRVRVDRLGDRPGTRRTALGAGLHQSVGGIEPGGHVAVGRRRQDDVADPGLRQVRDHPRGRPRDQRPHVGGEAGVGLGGVLDLVLAEGVAVAAADRVAQAVRHVAADHQDPVGVGGGRGVGHVRRDAGVLAAGQVARSLPDEPAEPDRRG